MAAAMSETAELTQSEAGPWNPGLLSELPRDYRPLCTIYRETNSSSSRTALAELRLLTGIPEAELVTFRPERLLLHELLVRVTADFSVPDGPRIEDLGINFRRIVTLLLERHLAPRMGEITATFAATRRHLQAEIAATLDRLTRAHQEPRRAPPRRGLARWLRHVTPRPPPG